MTAEPVKGEQNPAYRPSGLYVCISVGRIGTTRVSMKSVS